MKALTIKQPALYHIAAGFKTVELRTWVTPYRGPILLCSSASASGVARALPCGYALLIADLIDIKKLTPELLEAAYIEDLETPEKYYAWQLDNIRLLADPFKIKGKLRLFDVDFDETAADLIYPPFTNNEGECIVIDFWEAVGITNLCR